MHRMATTRLRDLKARTDFLGLARYVSTSAVATKSSGGFFSWLTGEKTSSLPPLDFPLKDTPLPEPLPDYVEHGETKITTLPNGVKIASETSKNPVASMGLFVDCGSIYETPDSMGVTRLLERMAFKSTINRSHLRVVREVEAIGGHVASSASREHMGYTFDALKTYIPEMVELLVDCVRNPAFLDWEVSEEIHKLRDEIRDFSKNPENLLIESVHSTGYSGPYGNPLVTESAVCGLNSNVLEEFVSKNYTAPRMVLSASGVDHDKLLEYAEPLLRDLPENFQSSEPPRENYTGGDFRCQDGTGVTHIALAFELHGCGWRWGWEEKDAMALTVLQLLMGGGGSFSAGGPGKGMYSRLYRRVLNEYPQIQSFSAFTNIYNHSAIFGILSTTDSDFAPTAIDIAVKELTLVASPGEVDEAQLERAKQATKSSILMNLESRMVASEDIAKQILTYGRRKPVKHFLDIIDSIKLEDIVRVARLLLGSPLTMACHGYVLNLPSYGAVSRKFGERMALIRNQ